MGQVSFTDFRQNLAGYLDGVENDREPLLVTRQGHPNVIVMSEDEFRGWQETVYLLRSPKNAGRLLQSIAQADAGSTAGHDLIEP
jgi:antitoxin YefM